MAPIMPMPLESELPDGPHRDCAGELRRCCRAPGSAGLTIGVRRGAGHVLVTVAGEVDIATVPGCASSFSPWRPVAAR
jgi:hypothetical protein